MKAKTTYQTKYFQVRFGDMCTAGCDTQRLQSIEEAEQRIQYLTEQEKAGGYSEEEKHIYQVKFERVFVDDLLELEFTSATLIR